MRTHIQRSVQQTACSSLLFLSALGAAGQGAFQNLGFEDTTVTAVLVNPLSGSYRYIATLPGWTWSPVGNFLNADPSAVSFNDIALDAPAVTLHGTDSPFEPVLSGNYTLLLQGGTSFIPPQEGGASIFQTGQIPLDAKSLTYLGGAGLQVSFNGQSLWPIALESTPSYTEWGVNISPYAGQSGELRFAVPWQDGSLLDGIQFSSTPIPEPSVVPLSLLGFVLFRAFTPWASRSRRPTPGEGLLRIRTPLTRRGCARRWA